RFYPLRNVALPPDCFWGDDILHARYRLCARLPLLLSVLLVFCRDHNRTRLLLQSRGFSKTHDLERPDVDSRPNIRRWRCDGRDRFAGFALLSECVFGAQVFVRAFQSVGPIVGASPGGFSPDYFLAILDASLSALQRVSMETSRLSSQRNPHTDLECACFQPVRVGTPECPGRPFAQHCRLQSNCDRYRARLWHIRLFFPLRRRYERRVVELFLQHSGSPSLA